MCGIAGAVGHNPVFLNESAIRSMTDAIAHRGPDGSGLWSNTTENIFLGHRRLSIIDLSVAGAQPMHFGKRYSMVFNGEIYNYVELRNFLLSKGYSFNSSTDSEVLLALYDLMGIQCLDQLDGMFAFAIWDNEKSELFCARDRFGEKPFYYSLQKDSFVFCSEIKGIWAAGIERAVNNVMLFNYKFFGHIFNPESLEETFYANIMSLPPASYLIVNKNGQVVSNKKYWDIDYKSCNSEITIEQACLNFQDLFDTSVKRKLRSDVTVGSSLSGGLDSSSIVCTVDKFKEGTQPLKTFSARFPGFKKDESTHIDQVLKATNADGYSCFPDKDLLSGSLASVVQIQDEPFRSSSILVQYEVMSLAKREKTIVLLDGQGADEYLAGYHGFIDCYFNELYTHNRKEFIRQFEDFRKVHSDNQVNTLKRRVLGMHLKRNLSNNQLNSLNYIKTLLSSSTVPSSLKDVLFTFRKDVFQRSYNFSSLNQMLYDFTMKGSLQELLRYSDRNSMAHSREVRLPFLYHNLVEFVFTLPSRFKINSGFTKFVLRKALENRMPSTIVWRKDKVGYEPPDKNSIGGQSLSKILIDAYRLQ